MDYFLQIIWRTISQNKITDFMLPVKAIKALPDSGVAHHIDESLCKIKEVNNFDLADQRRDPDKLCIITLKYKLHIKADKKADLNTDLDANSGQLQYKASSLALLAGSLNEQNSLNLQNLCDALTSVTIGHCSYTTKRSTLQFQLYRSSNVLLVAEKLHDSFPPV